MSRASTARMQREAKLDRARTADGCLAFVVREGTRPGWYSLHCPLVYFQLGRGWRVSGVVEYDVTDGRDATIQAARKWARETGIPEHLCPVVLIAQDGTETRIPLEG